MALDPHDARRVLHRLAQRITLALQAGAHTAAWRCRRVLPRVDGTARIDLVPADPAADATLAWRAPPPPDDDSPPRHWGRLTPSPGAEALQATVAGELTRSLARPAFALLPWVNRDRRRFVFDDTVVDCLLAGRLALGATRWFDWVLAEVFQDESHRFSLHFDGPLGRLSLQVADPRHAAATPPDQAAAPILTHRLFHLGLTADPRGDAQRARVPHQVERFVGFLLSRAVHPRLEPPAPDAAEGATDGPDEPVIDVWADAPVSTSRWGNPRQWRQFFSDFEVARATGNLQFCEPVVSIVHGEPECHRVEPQIQPRPHVFARRPFAPVEPPPVPGGGAILNVLGERETVLGGDALLRRAIGQAMAHRGSRFVFVNNTCLPKLIGDDLPSSVAEARRTGRKPVLDLNTDLDSPVDTYAHLVEQLADATAAPAAPAPPDAPAPAPRRAGVALLGYPAGRGREELLEWLTRRGIAVAGCLGPELSVSHLQAYRRAALHVVYPEPPWPDLQRLFDAEDVPSVTPPAPFGLRDSGAWLAAIEAHLPAADAAPPPPAAREALPTEGAATEDAATEGAATEGAATEGAATEDAATEDAATEDAATEDAATDDAAWRARFAALRDKARAHGVGLVVDPTEVERLWSAERCYGVRLLPLLEELGFALTVLVRREPDGPRAPARAPAAAEPDDIPARLREVLRDPSRLTVGSFTTETELAEALRAGPFELLYSEVACDARASRAGLTGFALDWVELGPAGALRTLERLLHAARWPFYRRYAHYLPPRPETPGGERLDP